MPESPNQDEVLRFLASTVESLRDKLDTVAATMATKDDLATMASKEDLATMATKDDLATLNSRMMNEFVLVRGDIERIDLRMDSFERTLNNRLDTVDLSVSRLRSAVYLLAKDQPEILKLLGPS